MVQVKQIQEMGAYVKLASLFIPTWRSIKRSDQTDRGLPPTSSSTTTSRA